MRLLRTPPTGGNFRRPQRTHSSCVGPLRQATYAPCSPVHWAVAQPQPLDFGGLALKDAREQSSHARAEIATKGGLLPFLQGSWEMSLLNPMFRVAWED